MAARLEAQLRQGFPLSSEQRQQWDGFCNTGIIEMQGFVDRYCFSKT
jgi:hypothetical protein